MKKSDIIRAWKDTEYRASLTNEELSALPDHPAGIIELSDEDLSDVSGGNNTEPWMTLGCCGTVWIYNCGTSMGWRTYGCCPIKLDYEA